MRLMTKFYVWFLMFSLVFQSSLCFASTPPLGPARIAILLIDGEALPLPEAKVGEEYNFQFQAEGGLVPLTWRVKEGELPPGVKLDPSGKLQGAPTVPRQDMYKFTVEVSDSSQPPQRFTQSLALMTRPAPLRMVLTPSRLKIIPPQEITGKVGEVSSAGHDHQASSAQTAPEVEAPLAFKKVPQLPLITTLKGPSDRPDDQPKNSAGRQPLPAPTATPIPSLRADRLDPARFVRIYEATKNHGELIPNRYGKLIYDPNSESLRSTKLSADENSTLIIEPAIDLMNLDMALNNLYINAELASGDTRTPLEVIGYSEIGKAQNAALAQQGMAFQSVNNLVALMLNLAFTAYDIIDQSRTDAKQKKVTDLTFGDFNKEKAKQLLRLYRPEIVATTDFLKDRKHLNLVEIMGTEVFWIDRASMQSIATKYIEDLPIALDDANPKHEDALRDLVERTLRIVQDLQDPISEIDLMTKHFDKDGQSALRDKIKGQLQEEEKDLVERLSAAIKLERIDLAGSLAQQIYARLWAHKAFAKLKKLFAPGYISLSSARAKDQDNLTLKVEARSSDVEGPGIPALFEVTVKQFGAKVKVTDSFMFIKRLGLTEGDTRPTTAPMPGRGLKPVNFAPSPGVTLGVNFFKRGNDSVSKFLRGLAPGVGVNVSFMNFDDPGFDLATGRFTNTNGTDVEVGAGIVGMLFNNKVQFTYGFNLNAEARRTYFGVGFSFVDTIKALANRVKE